MAGLIKFTPGTDFSIDGNRCRFQHAVSGSHALVVLAETGEQQRVRTADLKAWKAPANDQAIRHLETLSMTELEQARRRLEIIRPLLNLRKGKMKALAQRAKETNVSVSTLRRWLAAYEPTCVLAALAPHRKGRVMPTKLDKRVEKIIAQCVEKYFNTPQKVSQKKLIEEVQLRCRKRGLDVPHANTIRARLKSITSFERTKRREGLKPARDKYGEIRGPFPGGQFPLQHVEIDHTRLDIILVDDEDREATERVWLTLAIDVFSRMVTGLYLSLDHPSALSVGLCMAHSMLPKETYLAELGVDGDWPVWGKPVGFHTDNGKEFHSEAIKSACEDYDISLEWRPVKTPHFGGHIERFLGTLSKEIHALPGTTFSNPRQRGEYNSEKAAAFSMRELERLIVDFIVNVYHVRLHKMIGMPPLAMWNKGISGDATTAGKGPIDKIADEKRLHISFLPSKRRTVQRDGISLDGIKYYSPVLRHWINEKKGGEEY